MGAALPERTCPGQFSGMFGQLGTTLGHQLAPFGSWRHTKAPLGSTQQSIWGQPAHHLF